MGDNDQPPTGPRRHRGLEAVVRLYISRPRREPSRSMEEEAASPFGPSSGEPEPEPAGPDSEHRADERPRAASPSEALARGEDPAADLPPHDDHDEGSDLVGDPADLPPHDDHDEGSDPVGGPIESLRLGEEGACAESLFHQEARLAARTSSETAPEITIVLEDDPAVSRETRRQPETPPLTERSAGSAIGPRLAPETVGGLPESARVVLTLAAAPPGIRRILGERLAEPLTAQGRRVLLVESDPTDLDSGLFEQALGLDVPLLRRWMGASTREILLMPAAERKSLFSRLAVDERRSELVVMDLGLPESIFCSRLSFFVDELVVALTPRDSSLYEAYRALRGLQETRPDLTPFVVPFAPSAEDAQELFDRFQRIAKDFLTLPVAAGGWIELPGSKAVSYRGLAPGRSVVSGSIRAGDPTDREDSERFVTGEVPASPGLSMSLVRVLSEGPVAPAKRGSTVRDAGRAFFDHLGEWFGPIAP